jgi:small GTP-binding protein
MAQSDEDDDKAEEGEEVLWQSLQDKFDYQGRVTLPSEKSSSSSFRSGYVSVIGAPNMGKSTLVNALVEEPLCIATPRPQTTRHAILGIITTDTCQVCLLDTPGILNDKPAYLLQQGMMEAVQGALKTADVVLVVTDIYSTSKNLQEEPIIPEEDELWQQVQITCAKNYKPVIVVINKIDAVLDQKDDQKDNLGKGKEKQKEQNAGTPATKTKRTLLTVPEAVARWRQLLPNALAILPVSASEGSTDVGVQALRAILKGGPDVPSSFRALGRPIPGMFSDRDKTMLDNEQAQQLLPFGPPLYDGEQFTDRTERFCASEMIRAALLTSFSKELPYCCQVQVTSFKEEKTKKGGGGLIRIEATIFVERESQKKIVIGKQGAKIKQVGILARQSLQDFFQTKIFLQLQVAVDKDWRKNEDKLKHYGY